ncbi:alpha-(1,3)-fucosyltransferase C-like [Pomacea canaliculata]|nr:alpha-(1,3)-fucosyltransferase C-like [Pomacea canaliculata]
MRNLLQLRNWRLKVLLALVGLLTVLYLLTYSSANIWSQHSSAQNRSTAYYLLPWQSNSILKHSSTNSTFKYNGTATQRPCSQAAHPSTTYYLRHFRSIFIVDPATHQLTIDHQGNPSKISSEVRTDSRSSAVKNKLIVMYNMPEWIKRGSDAELFGHCPVSTCNLSTNYDADRVAADAVVFHDAPSHKPVPPRAFPDQVYVFHMIEPPPIAGSGYQNTSWNSAFNWTWTYTQDADIWVPYFFLERSKQLPCLNVIREVVQRKDTPVAWFVTNCQLDQTQRIAYVNRLQKILTVHVYGRCGTMKCPRMAKECDDMLTTKYFFYLSFENSYCQDYVTEKFSRAFFQGVHVVPIVRGGLDYSQHIPEGTFINADDYRSPEDLGKYLKELMNDEGTYIDMLWRIAHFTTATYHDSYTYSWCQLCDKLHRLQDNSKTYPDLFEWYHEGRCWPPKKL